MDLLPDDVPPVLGEDAKQFQNVIVEGVGKQFNGNEALLQTFVKKTRDYGAGTLGADEFWAYLENAFTEPRALVFLPKLARLVPDGERRRALLKAPKMASILRHNDSLPSDLAYTNTDDGPSVVRSQATVAAAVQRSLAQNSSSSSPSSSPDAASASAAAAAPEPQPVASANPWAQSAEDEASGGAAAASAAADEDDPFSEPNGAGATSAPPAPAPGQEKLSPDAQKVKEMFPDLPTPAILAALQKLPVAIVIERALGGQIDPHAVPSPEAPPKPSPSGRVLSGAMVRVNACAEKFPADCYPPHMLPRDLAKLQNLFPTAPTGVLQAELQVTGSLQTAQEALVNDQVHAAVLELDPVPVALRGCLVKSDPAGSHFTRRFFVLRQLTGSLCYAKLPEDMDDPLGVIYLFGSRAAPAPPDAKAAATAKYPELHGASGWSLITPHRTYHLFADSEAETIAWRSALSQMAMLMVPPEFDAGEDVVECEVFENEAYTIFSGWQPAPALPGQRLKYSNRKGELSSAEFPDVKLPGDFRWEEDWRVDKTYTSTDGDGWSYGGSFGTLEQQLERGESSGANSTFDFARRRRWVRASRRVDKADIKGMGGGGTLRGRGANRGLAGYGTDPDEHLVDFNGATSSQHQASGTSEPTASNGEFGIEDEDDPFADGL